MVIGIGWGSLEDCDMLLLRKMPETDRGTYKMSFCALEEAFQGPANPPAPALHRYKKPKKSKEQRAFGSVEAFTVPPALPGTPGVSDGEVLAGPPPAMPPDDGAGAVKMDDLFPLPGDTGDTDDWQKAFTLEGSQMPGPQGLRADGAVSVDGKATLWRQIAAPAITPFQRAPPAPLQNAAAVSLSAVPTELSQRLDVLTRQLESLTAPTHLQGTAELFLFVAIGLLLLLAIDTLLRFAVAAGSSVLQGGGGRGGGRRFRYAGKRWL